MENSNHFANKFNKNIPSQKIHLLYFLGLRRSWDAFDVIHDNIFFRFFYFQFLFEEKLRSRIKAQCVCSSGQFESIYERFEPNSVYARFFLMRCFAKNAMKLFLLLLIIAGKSISDKNVNLENLNHNKLHYIRHLLFVHL